MKRKTYSENQPKSFGPENLIEVNPDSWRESDWRGFFVMISDAQKGGLELLRSKCCIPDYGIIYKYLSLVTGDEMK